MTDIIFIDGDCYRIVDHDNYGPRILELMPERLGPYPPVKETWESEPWL